MRRQSRAAGGRAERGRRRRERTPFTEAMIDGRAGGSLRRGKGAGQMIARGMCNANRLASVHVRVSASRSNGRASRASREYSPSPQRLLSQQSRSSFRSNPLAPNRHLGPTPPAPALPGTRTPATPPACPFSSASVLHLAFRRHPRTHHPARLMRLDVVHFRAVVFHAPSRPRPLVYPPFPPPPRPSPRPPASLARPAPARPPPAPPRSTASPPSISLDARRCGRCHIPLPPTTPRAPPTSRGCRLIAPGHL